MQPARSGVSAPASFTRFGDLLRFLRRRAQLTQRDLGIAVGYNFAQICRLEQGQRLPDRSAVASTFVLALSLEQEPEWSARLVELAASAHQERHEAALAALTPAADRAPAQDQPAPTDAGAIEGIPDPAPYEVPRLRLVARLHARLLAERRVALCGLAGMGKTTLAAALAREYAQSTPVFWLTFTPGVTTSVEVVTRHLAHFLSAHGEAGAGTLLRRVTPEAAPPLDQQLGMLGAGLARLAARASGPHATAPLLCFDNAHLAQEDGDLVYMLRHLSATSGARLLLTSREDLQILPGCPQIRLGGLDQEEGREFIANLAQLPATAEAVPWAVDLIEKTGGSPMLVQLAVGELSDEQLPPAALIAHLESQPQIAAYLLETVRRHVSAAAWGLLSLVAVFRQPVNLYDPALIELIQEADGAPELAASLAELTRRHLIDNPARAYPHRLVRDYAYTALLTLPLHRRQLHRIAAEWSEHGLDDPIEASYHYAYAGELDDAAATLVEHAELLRERGRAFAAADMAEVVQRQARRHRAGGSDVVRRLLILRGDLLIETSRAAEAESSYRDALVLTIAPDEHAAIAGRLAQS
jgi:transcriptional regulator with XRE-family HTH domain